MVRRKAEEESARCGPATDDNAARRRLGVAQPEEGLPDTPKGVSGAGARP
ncbi:hypothetical protein GCM10027176_05720 [Actinoallomurus bryophytorum]